MQRTTKINTENIPPPKKTAVELNKEFSEEKNNNWLRNILKVLYYSLANKCCQRYREWKTPRNC